MTTQEQLDFIENEKAFNCLNQLFVLAQNLFEQKNEHPFSNAKTHSFIKFEVLEIHQIKKIKSVLNVSYNWHQKDKEKTNVWDHHDHYLFDEKATVTDFIDYFKNDRHIFASSLNQFISFIENPENKIIFEKYCPKVITLTDNENEFLEQKNNIINEKIRNTHEAYILEQSINQKSNIATKIKL